MAMLKKKTDFRLLMDVKGYTYDTLCAKSGLSSSMIAKLANGAIVPAQISLQTFLALCKAFEMKPEDLMRVLRIDYYGKK